MEWRVELGQAQWSGGKHWDLCNEVEGWTWTSTLEWRKALGPRQWCEGWSGTQVMEWMVAVGPRLTELWFKLYAITFDHVFMYYYHYCHMITYKAQVNVTKKKYLCMCIYIYTCMCNRDTYPASSKWGQSLPKFMHSWYQYTNGNSSPTTCHKFTHSSSGISATRDEQIERRMQIYGIAGTQVAVIMANHLFDKKTRQKTL